MLRISTDRMASVFQIAVLLFLFADVFSFRTEKIKESVTDKVVLTKQQKQINNTTGFRFPYMITHTSQQNILGSRNGLIIY